MSQTDASRLRAAAQVEAETSLPRAREQVEAWATCEGSPRGSVFRMLATELLAEHEALLAEHEREVASLRQENESLRDRVALLQLRPRECSPPTPAGMLLEVPGCEIPGAVSLEGGKESMDRRSCSKTSQRGSSKQSKLSSSCSPSPRHRLGRGYSSERSSVCVLSRQGSDAVGSVANSVASGFSKADMEEILAIAALGGKEETMALKWEKRNAKRVSVPTSPKDAREQFLSERKAKIVRSASHLSHQAQENCLRTKKVAAAVVNWWFFDITIGCAIIINSVTLGIETAHAVKDRPVPHIINVLEVVFLVLYIVELWLRIVAEGLSVFKSNWIKFDAVLVVAGLLDIVAKSIASVVGTNMVHNLTMVRLFRMIRVVRAARLLALAQFRTLWVLIEGLLSSVHPMLWTFVIMVLHLYVFALFGMELIRTTSEYGEEYHDIAESHFSGVGRAMMALLQLMTLDSVAAIYRPLIIARPELALYFFSFMLCGSISLMNLVTGIMVESAIRQAKEDQEAQRAWEAMKRKQMRPKLQELFHMLDTNGSGELELEELLDAPEMLQDQLNRICNMDDIEETFKILDHDDSGTVDLDEFCNGIMRVQHTEKPAELIRLVRQCNDIQRNIKYLARKTQQQASGNRHNALVQ